MAILSITVRGKGIIQYNIPLHEADQLQTHLVNGIESNERKTITIRANNRSTTLRYADIEDVDVAH